LSDQADGVLRLEIHGDLDLEGGLIDVIHSPTRCASSLAEIYRAGIASELASKTEGEITAYFKKFVERICHYAHLEVSTPNRDKKEKEYWQEIGKYTSDAST
jgi:hypothetical protein